MDEIILKIINKILNDVYFKNELLALDSKYETTFTGRSVFYINQPNFTKIYQYECSKEKTLYMLFKALESIKKNVNCKEIIGRSLLYLYVYFSNLGLQRLDAPETEDLGIFTAGMLQVVPRKYFIIPSARNTATPTPSQLVDAYWPESVCTNWIEPAQFNNDNYRSSVPNPPKEMPDIEWNITELIENPSSQSGPVPQSWAPVMQYLNLFPKTIAVSTPPSISGARTTVPQIPSEPQPLTSGIQNLTRNRTVDVSSDEEETFHSKRRRASRKRVRFIDSSSDEEVERRPKRNRAESRSIEIVQDAGVDISQFDYTESILAEFAEDLMNLSNISSNFA